MIGVFPEARVLHVDLKRGTTRLELISADTYRLYPGGSALASYLAIRDLAPRTDPLGPDNVLVFAVSPLTGLPLAGLSRVVVAAKSPLTGTMGDSQAGGALGAEIKANGYDAIVFHGRAREPVYLYIDGEAASLRPAHKVWGKVTGDTEDAIRAELGIDGVEVASIGPAGERLVRFACVINDSSRANGRTGMGAVMGSKNLKAVAIRRSKKPLPADPEGFTALKRLGSERLKSSATFAGLHEDGTAGELLSHHENGFLPTRNISTGWFPEGAEKITGAAITRTILTGRDTCYACPVRCKRVVEIPGKVHPRYGGPEYETCGALGSYCGVTSLESIAVSNQICNMYGMDTISCGATISFAIECFEKGLITREDTGGLVLRFGDNDVVPELAMMIAERKGFGDILAEGSLRAARTIGRGAESLSMAVKGSEIPAHMPQYKPGVAVIYAVNPFGADHQSSEHDPLLLMPPDSQERRWLGKIGVPRGARDQFALDHDRVAFAFYSQQFYSILDTLCMCQFVWGPSWQLYGPSDMVALCLHGIGWDTSLFELMLAGERRINMMRYFNAKEGFDCSDDVLPARFFEPLPEGPSKGRCLNKEEFEQARSLYYTYAGWEPETGIPTPGKIKTLSLGWML